MHNFTIQNREAQIAVGWSLQNVTDRPPHGGNLAIGTEQSIDLPQFCYNFLWVRQGHGDRAVDRFIRRENVKHYRELLKSAKEEAERRRISKLLAEEQEKQKDAGDKIEE